MSSKTGGLAEFIGDGIDSAISWAARAVGVKGHRRGRASTRRHRRPSAFNKRVSALMRKHPGMSLAEASRRASRG